jgi:hypothetical protein
MKRLSILSLVVLLSACDWFVPTSDVRVLAPVVSEPLSQDIRFTLGVNGVTEVDLILSTVGGRDVESETYFFKKDDLLQATAAYVDDQNSEVTLSARLVDVVPATYSVELSETPTGLRLTCEDAYTEIEGCP